MSHVDGDRGRGLYFNFLSGTPPPTHQSTIARTALSASPLPPFFIAKDLKPSNAFVLCTGDAWTIKVSAESRSESVPDERTRERNAASADDVPVDNELCV